MSAFKMKRPLYHFTPLKGWMNDPNGLIYDGNKYHLFYQYNPNKTEFGTIGWGHATSIDLKNWVHQPIALSGTEKEMIFSGTVVINQQPDLFIEKGVFLAIYTHHHQKNEKKHHQTIRYAISRDQGVNWEIPENNILIQRAEDDFRDPKVFWYEKEQKWIMVVALPKKYTVLFYESYDLLSWSITGEFTSNTLRNQFWECPDLFPLKNESGEKKWVLTLSGEGYNGVGWGMFYFIGNFDGSSFSTANAYQNLDLGFDFYAGITFEGLKNERIMMAWCGNWAYSNEIKREKWNGIMSSPRVLSLKQDTIYQSIISSSKAVDHKAESNAKTYTSPNSYKLTVNAHHFLLDRSMNAAFKKYSEYQQRAINHTINTISVYEDHGIIEILLNEGEKSLTFLI